MRRNGARSFCGQRFLSDILLKSFRDWCGVSLEIFHESKRHPTHREFVVMRLVTTLPMQVELIVDAPGGEAKSLAGRFQTREIVAPFDVKVVPSRLLFVDVGDHPVLSGSTCACGSTGRFFERLSRATLQCVYDFISDAIVECFRTKCSEDVKGGVGAAFCCDGDKADGGTHLG